FPFIIFVTHALDNAYILCRDGGDYLHLELPELLYQKMHPVKFWRQGSIIMGTATACCIFMYYWLWKHEFIRDAFDMFFIVNRRGARKLIVNGKGFTLFWLVSWKLFSFTKF